MSREIEFRAWDAGKGQMIDNVAVMNGCAMVWRNAPADSPVVTVDGNDGKRIFEGDIIEDEEHYYSVISWDSDDCMFVASDVGAMADLCCPVKVIGNIHQNPELLK